jgi:hypothetical protein
VMNEELSIRSRDYWVKVVEMLQQNWALIDVEDDGSGLVWFLDDHGGAFDQIRFASAGEACVGLARNGFRRFIEDAKLQSILAAPRDNFHRSKHPNGLIYSSGRFW